MGRLFTYEQIIGGQVPDDHDFAAAAAVFEQTIEHGIEDHTIDGAFIYGSVAIGQAGERSDLDIFIALPDSDPLNYRQAALAVEAARRESNFKIPIIPIVRPKSVLALGRHDLDRFFGEHIASNFRRLWGNDPAGYIAYPDLRADQILTSYLAQKKRRLVDTYYNVDPLDVEDGGLQRMIELPQAVGRKTMQALVEVGEESEAVARSADRGEVISRSLELFSAHGIESGFERLVCCDALYELSVNHVLDGAMSQREYEELIAQLHAEILRSVSWLEDVESAILPILTE